MNIKNERKSLIVLLLVFLLFYYLPFELDIVSNAVMSGLLLLNEYAREHVLTCLLPAFFIAGAISVFIRKETILKYLGAKAKKYISYSIASISGIALAVCSCTILPLFAGIRKRGAGLGPAITFLFSGPAINIAAIFLTISVLGLQIGLARIIASIIISIIAGLSMHLIFREKISEGDIKLGPESTLKYKNYLVAMFLISMVAVLIVNGLSINWHLKMMLIIVLSLLTFIIASSSFKKETNRKWLWETWKFSKMLIPLLFIGVFAAGFIMPFLPESLIVSLVGGNTILGNLVASVFGAFMYFSTLTEIPILQALMAKGMGQGPALALLLAGPSLSLPNLLVIRKVLGNKKTLVYALLVVFYSTIAGLVFGSLI